MVSVGPTHATSCVIRFEEESPIRSQEARQESGTSPDSARLWGVPKPKRLQKAGGNLFVGRRIRKVRPFVNCAGFSNQVLESRCVVRVRKYPVDRDFLIQFGCSLQGEFRVNGFSNAADQVKGLEGEIPFPVSRVGGCRFQGVCHVYFLCEGSPAEPFNQIRTKVFSVNGLSKIASVESFHVVHLAGSLPEVRRGRCVTWV